MGWIAFVAASAVAVAIVPPLLGELERGGSLRANFRGSLLPFPSGVGIVLSALLALAPLTVLQGFLDETLVDRELVRWLGFLLGVALLGLVDDLFGRSGEVGSARGWRGHARSVAGGNLSTGAIKAIGTVGLAALVLADRSDEPERFLVGVLLLAALTNLLNLMDTRPGRATKVLILIAAGLSAGAWTAAPAEALALFLGPVLVVGWLDLRERSMLGDCGSNLLGAIAAVWAIEALGATGELVALLVVLAVSAYGEFRSLGKSVEQIPLVQHLDSLGRLDWRV